MLNHYWLKAALFPPEEDTLEKMLDQAHHRENSLLIPGNPMALSEREPRSWKSPEYSALTKAWAWVEALCPVGNDQR